MQNKWKRTMSVISAFAVLLTSLPSFSLSSMAEEDESIILEEEYSDYLIDEESPISGVPDNIKFDSDSEESIVDENDVDTLYTKPNVYYAPNTYASITATSVQQGQCGAEGSNVTWTLDENGVLTISGSGKMKDYTNYITIDQDDNESGELAPWGRTGLKSVVTEITSVIVEKGVTSIGNSAFFGCKNIVSISLPDGLTSIGDWAFAFEEHIGSDDTFLLNEILIPESVTRIGDNAFYNQEWLTNINIPEYIEYIGIKAFYNTAWFEALKAKMGEEPIILNGILVDASGVTGDFKIPDNVRYISGYAAYNNKNITSITMPNSTYYIGEYAFAYCSNAASITLGTGITDIESYAFCGCNSITEITIPANVSTIGDQAFCATNLENIVVNNGNQYFIALNGILFNKQLTELMCYPIAKNYEIYSIPNSVKKIGSYAVYNNSFLKNIAIPDSVTEIGEHAFEYCEKLQSLTIPDSVTRMGESAFERCTALQEVHIGSGLETLEEMVFDGCTALKTVEFSEGLKTLKRYAFCRCRSLESINLPDSVELIGTEVFWCCLTLKDVHLGDGLKEIEDMAFYQCGQIESIIIPDNVESICYRVFYECSSLTEIIIPKSVINLGISTHVRNSYSGGHIFEGCTNLEQVTLLCEIPTIKCYMFNNCINLKSITLPNSVRTIDEYAFAGCSNLYTLTLPNNVRYINESAFSGCSSLRNISLPSGLYNIGKRAFYNCYGLTDIVIPDNVRSIGEEAFAGCVNLIRTYIPESVTSIGLNAFMTYGTDSKYTYNLFALSDVGSTLYDGVTAKLYIRTDNPDPDSFYISTSMPHSDSSGKYSDIKYKDPDDNHKIKAVDGGYIWVFDPEVSGSFDCMIVENGKDGKPVIATQFELTVNDYDTAYYAWMDEVIASQTTDSMTNFEKIEAISKYLRSTFKYLTNDGNNHLTSLASVPNSPYFAAHRWDSYISPSGLGQFALRIGGFDKVESLYSSYASYGFSWSNGHYLCYCEANGEGRFYEACPLSGTGAVESFTIDFSDASQLYTLNGLKKNSTTYQPLTIYGISASTAESYAVENSITFIAIAADVRGDINADGEFTMADVVILQKWLLAVPGVSLSNWRNGDFCEDDKLDVFDLCLMKRALIQQQN